MFIHDKIWHKEHHSCIFENDLFIKESKFVKGWLEIDTIPKLHELINELRSRKISSEGFQILSGLGLVNDALNIVNLNYEELKDYMIKCNEMEIKELFVNQKHNDYIELQFNRLLHNYLASVSSLINHTYSYVNKKPKLKKEWSKIAKKHFDKGCTNFVKELRNYAQHYKIPILSPVFTLTLISEESREYNPDYKILLNKDIILAWDKWSKKSKEYIARFDELNLGNIFSDYQLIINDVYPILDELVLYIYDKQLDFVFTLENRMKEIYQKIEKIQNSKTNKKVEMKIRFKDSIYDLSSN